MKWVDYVTCVKEKRNASRVFLGKKTFGMRPLGTPHAQM
jgi:hypothetical protein